MLRARKNMYWKGDNERYDLCFVIEDPDSKKILEQDDFFCGNMRRGE